MGRRVDVSVLLVAASTWRIMSELQVRLEDLVEVLQRGVELADDGLEEDVRDAETQPAPTTEPEGERDERGRRIVRRRAPIRRSRDWREPTLIWLGEQPNQEAEVRRYAEAFGISRGAASMRMAELRREGKVTAASHGRARLVEVQP
jgi:hypothetical protein